MLFEIHEQKSNLTMSLQMKYECGQNSVNTQFGRVCQLTDNWLVLADS